MLLCKYTLSILMLMPRRHYSPTPHPALNSLSLSLVVSVCVLSHQWISVSVQSSRQEKVSVSVSVSFISVSSHCQPAASQWTALDLTCLTWVIWVIIRQSNRTNYQQQPTIIQLPTRTTNTPTAICYWPTEEKNWFTHNDSTSFIGTSCPTTRASGCCCFSGIICFGSVHDLTQI